MSLTPGTTVLLRRRGKRDDYPWVYAHADQHIVYSARRPDGGWKVHDGGNGTVLLESLTLKRDKFRWFGCLPGGGLGGTSLGGLFARNTSRPIKWVAHPDGRGGFLLEYQSKAAGPKWLHFSENRWATFTERPEGRSAGHEFVALPVKPPEEYMAAEEMGDYSFMTSFGMNKAGKVLGLPKKPKPDLPVWASGRPGRSTPKKRAGRDPVARELVAALQPSFDDAAVGVDCSMYESEDDPRAIVWPHNILSLNTVATPTGIVHHFGEPVKHTPPKGELARCRTLAGEVAAALKTLRAFNGDAPTPFRPFYLVIGTGEKPPAKLTGRVIQAAFRGTIYPGTSVRVKPLTHPDFAEVDGGWLAFAAWAEGHEEVAGLYYVEVGSDTGVGPNLAAVFPRLVLGLTKAGSLVGACGSIVQA